MNIEVNTLITSLGLAVSQSQQEIETQSISNFLSYFNKTANSDENNNEKFLEPQVTSFHIASNDGEIDKVIDVPIVTMALHNSVSLEQVKINLNIHPYVDENGIVMTNVDTPENDNVLFENKNGSTLELLFKRNAQSEGIARLYTEICKKI